MPILKALIFDIDGTLAETERDGHRVAFNRAFADVGLDWDWTIDLYGKLLAIAGGKERIQHYIDTYSPIFESPDNLTDWIAYLHQRKTHYYQQLLATGTIPLRPGVQRLIQEARQQGIRLAIATTSALDNVTPLLEIALAPESPTWFEVIAAGDMVPVKKPDPAVYTYVLEAMGLLPEECLAIEDSEQGVQAAVQAGIKTVVTINDYTQHHPFVGAMLVLNHLGEPDLPYEIVQRSPELALTNHSELPPIFNLEFARALI